MSKYFYSLGLMSGTSMDGIDSSIIRSDGEQFVEIIDDMYLRYDRNLILQLKKTIDLCYSRERFKKLSGTINELEKQITIYHVKVCSKILKRNRNIKVDLIGFHGQTILHKPEKGYSIQIGNSKLLSKQTKIKVISNFREKDILNGGQGAPLTPLYHKLILNKINSKLPSAIINIGGISNITYQENKNKIISFDTGPGNYLIDAWVKSNSKMEYDDRGLLAKSGEVDYDLLKKLMSNSYYKKKHPKSLDVKEFNIKEVKKLSLENGCSTLAMLTVKTICMAINSLDKLPNEILVAGGGRKNEFIIDNLKKIIKKPVNLVDKFNFDGDFVESQAFAYLAIRSFLKKIISYPSTTGVSFPVTGGQIYN